MAPKQMIRDALKRFGYEIRRTPVPGTTIAPLELPLVDVLDLLFCQRLKSSAQPFFVQIGANDGSTADPMHDLVRRYHVQGLLVEPQPHAFQALVENYRDETQLRFENCLLGSTDGLATFYTVRRDVEGLPFWLHQSASLDRSIVEKALRIFRDVKGVRAIPEDHESLIEAISVPSVTWRTLLQRHRIPQIDVLVIDTMGFDFEIIKLFPFDLMKPHIIHFEHSMLTPEDQRACLEGLTCQGYSLAKVAVDTIACLDVKTRKWQLNAW